MIADPVLIHDWHPLCWSTALVEGALLRARLLELENFLNVAHFPLDKLNYTCIPRTAIAYRRWLGQLGLTFGTG